jgi:hypothetical protein
VLEFFLQLNQYHNMQEGERGSFSQLSLRRPFNNQPWWSEREEREKHGAQQQSNASTLDDKSDRSDAMEIDGSQ